MNFLLDNNTRQITEAGRFNKMLGNIAMTLPYSQLIKNDNEPIRWFDNGIGINSYVELKQADFGF